MADRIVVLHDGAVQQYDTPEQVYERPANQFVASFIGSPAMNFFTVEILDGKIALANDERVLPINGEDLGRLRRAGGRAVLGVRPEHFTVGEQETHAVAVVVKLVEPLGSDTMIHFDLGGTSAISRVDPALKPKVGDLLALGLQPNRIHLFDAATGQVLS